jgi:hypothetical protein
MTQRGPNKISTFQVLSSSKFKNLLWATENQNLKTFNKTLNHKRANMHIITESLRVSIVIPYLFLQKHSFLG